MWIVIDTSERGRIWLAKFDRSGRVQSKTFLGRQSPVVALSKFISSVERKQLRGVLVHEGPGSFSAIRSGVLAANLLSRLLRAPLYAITAEQIQDLASLRTAILEGRLKPQAYVAPIYDRAPNITCPS